jgi:centromeric protein E
MRKLNLLKLIITFFISLIQISEIKSEKTSWKDPITGFKYDWSNLKRKRDNPYVIKDEEVDEENFDIKYYFNIGNNLNQKCKNKTSSIIEFLEYEGKRTNICEILGTEQSFDVHLIDNENPNLGIFLEYGDGDICKTSQDEELMGYPRKTRFKLYCSKNENESFILDYPEGKQGTTKCILEFKIYSPSGCPITFLSQIKPSKILSFILILFGIYLVFGYAHNSFFYRLKGKAAIPNYIFWSQFPFLVLEGISFIKDNINNFINICFNKNKNK